MDGQLEKIMPLASGTAGIEKALNSKAFLTINPFHIGWQNTLSLGRQEKELKYFQFLNSYKDNGTPLIF